MNVKVGYLKNILAILGKEIQVIKFKEKEKELVFLNLFKKVLF